VPSYWDTWPDDKDWTRLLRVNRQINHEASRLLWTAFTYEHIELYRGGGGLYCHGYSLPVIASPLIQAARSHPLNSTPRHGKSHYT